MNNSQPIEQHIRKSIDAIACLIENNFIESALALTYISIDQLGWLSIENQESDADSFKAWVDKYLNPLDDLGCSANDLWAARNGLLHMGISESRDIYRGKAKPIYYTTGNIICTTNNNHDTIIVNATKLIAKFIYGATVFTVDLEKDAQKLAVAAHKAQSILSWQKI